MKRRGRKPPEPNQLAVVSLSCGLPTAEVINPTHPAPAAPIAGNACSLAGGGQTQPPHRLRAASAFPSTSLQKSRGSSSWSRSKGMKVIGRDFTPIVTLINQI